jgi:hypothetical protein
MGFRVLALVAFSVTMFAQQRPSWERIGALRLNRAPATWTSPESLVRDLRSGDKAIRLKALRLLGADSEAEYLADGSANEIELRYASLGESPTKQAIVLFAEAARAYAAIATPLPGTWKRVAVFECFWQYEESPILNDFVRIEYTDHRDFSPGGELVVRTRGGGTGLVEETEERFWLHEGEFRLALSFVNRRDAVVVGSGDRTAHERRLFRNNQLVDAKAAVTFELENEWRHGRNFNLFTCTPYKWDSANFKYAPSGAAHPCKYEPPK